jgi:hypothetical protein
VSPRSPAFTNVSIHASTSDCFRSCSRHTSASFRSPGLAERVSQPFASASTAGTPLSPSPPPRVGCCTPVQSKKEPPQHYGEHYKRAQRSADSHS